MVCISGCQQKHCQGFKQDKVNLSRLTWTKFIDNYSSRERTENWYCSTSYSHVNASVIACNVHVDSFLLSFFLLLAKKKLIMRSKQAYVIVLYNIE